MCRAKTNTKQDRGKGNRFDDHGKFDRSGKSAPGTSWGSTAHRRGANYKHSDAKADDAINDKLNEYYTGNDQEGEK